MSPLIFERRFSANLVDSGFHWLDSGYLDAKISLQGANVVIEKLYFVIGCHTSNQIQKFFLNFVLRDTTWLFLLLFGGIDRD